MNFVCSLWPIGSWLTACQRVPQNPICSIPYAHSLVTSCDPPGGPPSILNGGAHFDILNKGERIFNASEENANALAVDQEAAGQLYTLIQRSHLTRKNELANLVLKICDKIGEASVSLADVYDDSVPTALKKLSDGPQRHSRAPIEADLENYRDDWINFFQSVIDRFDAVVVQTESIINLLLEVKNRLFQIRVIIMDEQNMRTEIMDQQRARRNLCLSNCDISDVAKDAKILEDLDFSYSTSSSAIVNLRKELRQLQANSRMITSTLRLPETNIRLSIPLRDQIVEVNDAVRSLENSRNAALAKRRRISENGKTKQLKD